MKTPEIGAIVVHLTIVDDPRTGRRLTRIEVPACALSFRAPNPTHGPKISFEPGVIRVGEYRYPLHPQSPAARTNVVRMRTWCVQQLLQRLRVWGFRVHEFQLEPGYEELLRSAGCIPAVHR